MIGNLEHDKGFLLHVTIQARNRSLAFVFHLGTEADNYDIFVSPGIVLACLYFYLLCPWDSSGIEHSSYTHRDYYMNAYRRDSLGHI